MSLLRSIMEAFIPRTEGTMLLERAMREVKLHNQALTEQLDSEEANDDRAREEWKREHVADLIREARGA